MAQRNGQGLRSKRPPTGWPLIAKYIVPALYHYLHPFYPPTRPYRLRKALTPGRFHMQLLRDIADIVRLELPYARDLTVGRVKAAVQRHIKPKEKTTS